MAAVAYRRLAERWGLPVAKITLTSYAIRIRDVDLHENLPIGDVNGADFFQLASDYLGEREQSMSHDEANQRLLSVRRWGAQGRTISGVIETGEYGHESDLFDVERGAVSYRRRRYEAEMLPFYFYMSLPEQADEGLLILQRFQTFGIRTVLWADLSIWLQERQDQLRLAFNPLAVGEAWKEQLRPEAVRAIRFVSFDLPHEVARALELEGQEEEVATVEYVVRARRRHTLPIVGRIREFMDGRRDWHNIIELENFDYDEVKLEVDFGGSRRTLEMSHPEELRVRFDITEAVQLGNDGHPQFGSIDGIAREYARDLSGRLRGGHA